MPVLLIGVHLLPFVVEAALNAEAKSLPRLVSATVFLFIFYVGFQFGMRLNPFSFSGFNNWIMIVSTCLATNIVRPSVFEIVAALAAVFFFAASNVVMSGWVVMASMLLCSLSIGLGCLVPTKCALLPMLMVTLTLIPGLERTSSVHRALFADNDGATLFTIWNAYFDPIQVAAEFGPVDFTVYSVTILAGIICRSASMLVFLFLSISGSPWTLSSGKLTRRLAATFFNSLSVEGRSSRLVVFIIYSSTRNSALFILLALGVAMYSDDGLSQVAVSAYQALEKAGKGLTAGEVVPDPSPSPDKATNALEKATSDCALRIKARLQSDAFASRQALTHAMKNLVKAHSPSITRPEMFETLAND